MNYHDRIAVIVAAYNIENRIEKCIASVQMQTYSNWVLYVVDDGSTDNTGILLDKIAQTDTRIQVMHIANSGKWKAHRMAIDAVNACEYIMFLDSDDELINKNLFQICLKEFLDEGVDIVSFNYVRNGKKCFEIKRKLYLCEKKEKVKNMLTGNIMDGNICCACYRYNIVQSNYKIMPYNHEDYRNKYDFITNANKIVILPITGYFYYMNADSITHRRITDRDGYYYINAEKFSNNILLEYSDLEDECNYFVGSILIWLVRKLQQDKENERLRIYRPIMKAFWSYFRRRIFINNHYFSLENKIVVCLIRFNLYRPARICIHRLISMKNALQSIHDIHKEV